MIFQNDEIMFVFKAVGECIYPVMMGGQKPTDIQQEKYDKLKEVKIQFFLFFFMVLRFELMPAKYRYNNKW